MNKSKQVFYELNPRFFKDANGDGIGDFRGLAQKIEYFNFLGVDGVILQDSLATQSNDSKQDFKNISSDLGTINDFIKFLSLARHRHLQVFLELKIDAITSKNNWFSMIVDEHSQSFDGLIKFHSKRPSDAQEQWEFPNASINLGYYVQKNETKEIPLNWQTKTPSEKFIEVIKFWYELGVSGFVIKGFEKLACDPLDISVDELISEDTIKILKHFYADVKNVNEKIVLIGKSDILDVEYGNLLTQRSNKIFDLFISTFPSMMGTKNNSADVIGDFKLKNFAAVLNSINEHSENIVSLGSSRVGRIVSRWGTEGQFHMESAKQLAIALLLTSSTSVMYYSDELGTKNLGLKANDNFFDSSLEERKKMFVGSMYSEEDFMSAQILQNPINARNLMAWNDGKNAGFSFADEVISPVGIAHKHLNVEVEFADKDSILNFYKALIELLKRSDVKTILQTGKYSAKALHGLSAGVLKIRIANKKHEIVAFLNFTNTTKILHFWKRAGKILLSNYPFKEYSTKENTYTIHSLEAYEAVIVSWFTDEYTKQLIITAKEHEKTRAMNLKKENELRSFEQRALTKVIEVPSESTREITSTQKIKNTKETKVTKISDDKNDDESLMKAANDEKNRLSEKNKDLEQRLKERTRQLEMRELVRLEREKEKTKLLEIKEQERSEREKEKTKLLEIKEQERIEREKEKTKLLEIKEQERSEREKEKTKQVELREKTKAIKLAEKQRFEDEKTKENVIAKAVKDLEFNKEENSDEKSGLTMEKEEKSKNQKKKHDAPLFSSESSIDFEKAARRAEKEAVKEAKKLEKQANRLKKLEAREKIRLAQTKAKAISSIEHEKELALEMDQQASRSARRHGEKTTLLDEQVAKTTQVDIDDVVDVQSFLEELDNKHKKSK